MKAMIAFYCSFLFLAQAKAADLTIPTITEVSPSVATKCVNDGTTTITVGSTDGTYLYGTASYEGWVCRLKVHSGRGPGIVKLSGCAEVVWSAATGEVVSIASQGCAQ
jgi:hypothetical protein